MSPHSRDFSTLLGFPTYLKSSLRWGDGSVSKKPSLPVLGRYRPADSWGSLVSFPSIISESNKRSASKSKVEPGGGGMDL